MIFGPPAAPTVITGFPALSSTIVGLMLDNGRLPGAMLLFSAPTSLNLFGTPGKIEKSSISLLRTTPVPGTITLEPNVVLTVAVIATQLPAASAAAICVVCRPKTSCDRFGGEPCDGTSIARVGSILAASCLAYSFEISPRGTVTKSESPNQYARS